MTAAVVDKVTPTAAESAPARTRQRVSTGLRHSKVGAMLAGLRRIVVSDLRSWWLVVDQPGPLTVWLAAAQPAKVPADNRPLRVGASIDKWFTGLPFVAVSALLFAAAGAFRWLAGHPARRWTALLITVVSVGAAVISTHLTGGSPR